MSNFDSNRSSLSGMDCQSQSSDIRARRLEEEFNLANKSKVLEQFLKFSKESMDDILNSSSH